MLSVGYYGDAMEIILALIAGISSVCTIIFGYLAFSRGKKQDHQGEAAQMAVLNANIGEVRGGVTEIKTRLERMDDKQDELRTDLAQVKESTNQAHKRINGHETRIGRLEEKVK